MSRKGLDERYSKQYFQGANEKDVSFLKKFPDQTECKNTKTKAKKRKRKTKQYAINITNIINNTNSSNIVLCKP